MAPKLPIHALIGISQLRAYLVAYTLKPSPPEKSCRYIPYETSIWGSLVFLKRLALGYIVNGLLKTLYLYALFLSIVP